MDHDAPSGKLLLLCQYQILVAFLGVWEFLNMVLECIPDSPRFPFNSVTWGLEFFSTWQNFPCEGRPLIETSQLSKNLTHSKGRLQISWITFGQHPSWQLVLKNVQNVGIVKRKSGKTHSIFFGLLDSESLVFLNGHLSTKFCCGIQQQWVEGPLFIVAGSQWGHQGITLKASILGYENYRWTPQVPTQTTRVEQRKENKFWAV